MMTEFFTNHPALFAGLAYFGYVFFKAFQQKNVTDDHYRWVMPTSYGMSFTEVLVVSLISITAASKGWSVDLFWFGFSIGTGGGLGAMISMLIHNKYVGKKEK